MQCILVKSDEFENIRTPLCIFFLRWLNTVFDTCAPFTFFSKTLDPLVTKNGREQVNNTNFSFFTMSSHISKLCSVAFYHLCNIRRIRKYLSQETAETLVHAFITSRIDYCNSLLYGLPNNQLAKIQRVLNASARLVCNAPRFCHITPIMRDLHWLPIRARINFKVLLLTFKALYGLAPQYLQSLISVKTSCYNLRGSNTLLLAMPSVKSKVTLGDRAFAIAAPLLWNSLPSELRSITCVTSFKAHLKTFLFRNAYT